MKLLHYNSNMHLYINHFKIQINKVNFNFPIPFIYTIKSLTLTNILKIYFIN